MLDKSKVIDSTKRLERDLYKINLLAESFGALEQYLSKVHSDISEAERVIEQNPLFGEYFTEGLKDKNIISLYKELGEKLSAIKSNLEHFEEKLTRTDMFLENFRNYRLYEFSSLEQAIAFMLEGFAHYRVKEVLFSPKFIGTLDMNKVAQDNILTKGPKSTLIIPLEKVDSLIKYLSKKDPTRVYKFDSGEIKAEFRPSNQIYVEAGNDKIKRLDRVCRQMEGNYSHL